MDDPSRLVDRLIGLVVETALCFGILAGTSWLVIGAMLGEGWEAGKVRTYAAGGRRAAQWLGIVGEPRYVVIPDPVPPGTPAP
jgi:hypothetical protein